jgi:hypothetical protein
MAQTRHSEPTVHWAAAVAGVSATKLVEMVAVAVAVPPNYQPVDSRPKYAQLTLYASQMPEELPVVNMGTQAQEVEEQAL